jgi:hypothetical protein
LTSCNQVSPLNLHHFPAEQSALVFAIEERSRSRSEITIVRPSAGSAVNSCIAV